jgi:hypothetical protein
MTDVRTESAAVTGMAEQWPMIRHLLGGTSAMRSAGRVHLPQWPNESDDSYSARLKTATLYPAFARTVEILAGKPFAKSLTLNERVPARLAEWMADADLQGRNLHTFAAEVMSDCIGYGVSGVLVDYPTVRNVRNLAEERAVGARPYFTRYAPGTVLGWRSMRIGGATKLMQLRLLESVEVEAGEFGAKTIEQVRVLTPGAWAVYRKAEKASAAVQWARVDEGRTTLSEIPFVFFYGQRTGFGVGRPPLLELAHQNVEHWQSSSDQQTILHVARVPILAIIGADSNTEITVGAKSAVKLPLGAEMKFVEHTGAAISAGRESIKDLEERMRATGAELLVIKPGQVTATQTRSEDDGNKSALQRIAEGVEDALDQCLQFAAMWVGEAEGGNVALHKDFGANSLSDASAQLVVTMQQSGLISRQTAIQEQQRRGILSPDLVAADEAERVADEGPALGATE